MKRRFPIRAGAGVWILLAVAALSAGGPYAWAQEAPDAATVANQFLQAVTQGDSKGAFELCSSGLRRGKTAEDFVKSPEIASIFGDMKAWEVLRVVEKGSAVSVVTKLVREQGAEKVRAIGVGLLKVSGNYRVRDFALTPWVASEARFLRHVSDLYLRLEELELAEQTIQKAYGLDAKDPKVFGFLGYVYLEKRANLEEAQKLIQTAHEQDPNDPEFMDFLGWANHIANKRQESVQWFDQARSAFEKIEGYQSSPEYVRFSSHVDKAKAKGWRPTQT